MAIGYTYVDGDWRDMNDPLFASSCHGVWLSSFIFDGARAFEGVAPDLDRHCERTVNSAETMGLGVPMAAGAMEEIAREGIAKFGADAELYVRPMVWTDGGFVAPDPETVRFALTVYEMPMPSETGFTACLSTRRRPSPDMAPTDAKAACLYPNAGRAIAEARARGFDNAVMLDPMGNVAEFATANLFIVKDGVAVTPAPNGCFLNGITRQRVIKLLRDKGQEVVEGRVTPRDLMEADEIFNTGNYGKVLPVVKYEDRALQPGPVFRMARDLYWSFAHAGR
ncbi:branched-chain amino acid aminotransferase [Marivibrio halodurans]|uniref:Probable branched-chain-amino-acid aminotransferase n=1 Tax=Marivibrio halodurans TaxID=2039722 RepID=A0A8J7S4M1_9PROT|nr:branched-chain amino acid aminotransferase [Marivibrio halodurans]MBP5858463.1 branched-chain amino acid aminotransferase [Marivibrio halodurans]